MLHTGCRWRDLPVDLGCGSGHTAWRRLRHWQEAGVREQFNRTVLEKLSEGEILDCSRASIDAVSVRAKRGELTGPNPTDRGKPGTKYHLLTDRNGLPLHVLASATNTHDSVLFEPLLETSSAVRGRCGRPGRPRRRPDKLHADKGFRLLEVPSLPASAGHQGPYRPSWDRGQEPPRSAPLGRGAHHLLGLTVQAPGAALRPHRSHAVAAAVACCHPRQPSPTALGNEVMRPGLRCKRA